MNWSKVMTPRPSASILRAASFSKESDTRFGAQVLSLWGKRRGWNMLKYVKWLIFLWEPTLVATRRCLSESLVAATSGSEHRSRVKCCCLRCAAPRFSWNAASRNFMGTFLPNPWQSSRPGIKFDSYRSNGTKRRHAETCWNKKM